eukprot:TRINITY_DN19195_c0_g1_i1.p1 TRINITY_DN19195_c0_g1~~TRINITY_DN19195_c0_g1_i1.p1  ORF type:complete len:319 (-),score=35.26 TRINITY_DN19195_c0_g1_i1:66-1022(-)
MTTRAGKKYKVASPKENSPTKSSTDSDTNEPLPSSDISKLKRRPVNSDTVTRDQLATTTSVPPEKVPTHEHHDKTNDHDTSFKIIIIFFALFLLLMIGVSVSIVYETLAKVDGDVIPRPIDPKFGECVKRVSSHFPNQDSLLWKQIVKNYNYNRSSKRTVLCQTLITPRTNKGSVECLVRMLSRCLGEEDPFTFKASSDPIKSASILERHLNYTKKEVGYFKEITDFTHPIPTVFHAICDPDLSPYKDKVFFFTIVTDSLTKTSKEYSRREISTYITDILNQNWVTRDGLFPIEQIAAVISRIADVAYYIKQDVDVNC